MSDDALRVLARRWRATRDPTDEARLLAERLRTSGLDPARLELAASLGHGPALAIAGAPPPDPTPERWLPALDEGARAPLVRLLLLVAEERALGLDRSEGMRAALDAARAWLACPCEVHRRAASAEDDEGIDIGFSHDPAWAALDACVESVRWAIRPPAWGPENGLADALRFLPRLRRPLDARDQAEARAVRDALVAWALRHDARGPAMLEE